MDANDIGSGIVEISRKARFADTSLGEWSNRIKCLIEAQPGISDVVVTNVRAVGTAAGGSNGTYLFDTAFTSGEGLVEKSLVLRFLPVEGLFHRYDVREQFLLQRALEETEVPVPPQLWLDAEGAFLTRPGYIMAQVDGVSTPMTWMTSGIIADATPEDRREMTLEYVRALARIHAVDWQAAGLDWLKNRAAGTAPIERETNWYWEALLWSGADAYIESLAPVRDWLIANEPTDLDVVLCHGDANFGNYLYRGTRITGVLDWEMAFLGTPECDLSFIRTGDAIIQADVAWPEGALSYAEMSAEYEAITGRTLHNMEYFDLFTAFRIAVINVLAMKHFPAEVLAVFMPTLRRGPDICLQRAAALGAIATVPPVSLTGTPALFGPARTECRTLGFAVVIPAEAGYAITEDSHPQQAGLHG